MRRHLVLLLIACGFTFLVGLGRAAISDSDEAFYAEAAREMVETGDWITPRYNYEDRFEKPIFYYWLVAGVFLVTGPGEVAARLPAAMCAVLLVVTTWRCGRRWLGERTGFVAGCIAASNFGYCALARLALPDMPLASFMTLTTWLALEAAGAHGRIERSDGNGPWSVTWFTLAASATAAVAFLTKGPVALVLPLAIVMSSVWLGLLGRRRVLPVPLTAMAAGAAVFIVISAPWFIAMERQHGLAYMYRFFVSENVERFATDRYNEPRSIFFYVPILLGGLAPWSAFLLLWVPPVAAAIRTRRLTWTPHQAMLAIWAAAPLLFYSVSIGKQPRYILPVLPPLAILLADTLRRRIEGSSSGRTSPRFVSVLGTITGLLFIVFAVLLLRDIPLLDAVSPGATQLAAGFIMAIGVLVATIAWLHPGRLYAAVAMGSIATLLSLWFSVFSAPGTDPVERMAAALMHERRNHEPSATYRVFVRNLVFYTGVRQTDVTEFEDLVTFLQQPGRVLCVLRQRDLDRLRTEHHLEPRILTSLRYFNPAAVRMKTLFWPDPTNDIEDVHLVSNR